jgi:hypothetical protein
MGDGTGANRVKVATDAIERLLTLFRFERFAYLIMCGFSVLGLAACIVILLVRTEGSALPEVIGMFSASGVITFSIGQVLKMWSQALAIVEKASAEPAGDAE